MLILPFGLLRGTVSEFPNVVAADRHAYLFQLVHQAQRIVHDLLLDVVKLLGKDLIDNPILA